MIDDITIRTKNPKRIKQYRKSKAQTLLENVEEMEKDKILKMAMSEKLFNYHLPQQVGYRWEKQKFEKFG